MLSLLRSLSGVNRFPVCNRTAQSGVQVGRARLMLHIRSVLSAILLSVSILSAGCSQSDEPDGTDTTVPEADTASTSDDSANVTVDDPPAVDPEETPDESEPVTVIDGPSDDVPQGPNEPEPSAQHTSLQYAVPIGQSPVMKGDRN